MAPLAMGGRGGGCWNRTHNYPEVAERWADEWSEGPFTRPRVGGAHQGERLRARSHGKSPGTLELAPGPPRPLNRLWGSGGLDWAPRSPRPFGWLRTSRSRLPSSGSGRWEVALAVAALGLEHGWFQGMLSVAFGEAFNLGELVGVGAAESHRRVPSPPATTTFTAPVLVPIGKSSIHDNICGGG
uniref:Uncharacterized protein n=1 Tax=Oryza sativa subsp. japonica TaxID=39947 RepID=Q6YVV9_ORYSJ|nr:hypothetical protein [Oryza sativa Japonica Group]BAD30398.1 hypothetical protein [Oryza sativa Japonica Group]